MRANPERDLPDDLTSRLGELGPDERADVLLHYFLAALTRMERKTARKMKDELASRFGGRPCRGELCARMLELLDGHLAVLPRARRNATSPG